MRENRASLRGEVRRADAAGSPRCCRAQGPTRRSTCGRARPATTPSSRGACTPRRTSRCCPAATSRATRRASIPGSGRIRIALVADEAECAEGIDRIVRFARAPGLGAGTPGSRRQRPRPGALSPTGHGFIVRRDASSAKRVRAGSARAYNPRHDNHRRPPSRLGPLAPRSCAALRASWITHRADRRDQHRHRRRPVDRRSAAVLAPVRHLPDLRLHDRLLRQRRAAVGEATIRSCRLACRGGDRRARSAWSW